MLASLLLAATSTLVVATSRGDQSLALYAPNAPARTTPDALVLILSGEGGWRSFDHQLATWISARGYWVGGVDCMRYFWKPQDDRKAFAADIRGFADALARAAGAPKDARLVIAGFSFGADLAPWIAGAPDRDARIAALVMIGPDERGSLAFRVTEMMGFVPTEHVFDTAAALAEVKNVPVLFVHGAKDETSSAPRLANGFGGRKELVVIPGATHHFAGHEDELQRALLESLSRLLQR